MKARELLSQYGKGRRDFSGENLRGADLRGADLEDVVLAGADLRGAVLRDANLRGAVFRGSDLSGADLEDAILSWADLGGANLTGTVLEGELPGASCARQAPRLEKDFWEDGALDCPDLRAEFLSLLREVEDLTNLEFYAIDSPLSATSRATLPLAPLRKCHQLSTRHD